MAITGIIITKNEEDQIKECIENLKFCDEILVIDDLSSDKTQEFAKMSGAKVFVHDKKDNFAEQRNFGLSKAKNNWVLFVDADERVSSDLRGELVSISTDKTNAFLGYYVRRLDCVFGKVLKHGESGNVKLVRFGRRSAGKWKRAVHEEWEIIGKIGILKYPLAHAPHQDVFSFVKNINIFAKLHAQENYKEGKRSTIIKIVLMPVLKFLNNYFIKIGFADGISGFMVAMMMSMHSFLAWSNLWLTQKNIPSEKS